MAKIYTVVSPLVVLRNPEQGGRQEYVYQGSVLPSFVLDDDRKRLVDEGHVAASGDADVTPATTPDEVNPFNGAVTPVGVVDGTSAPAPAPRTMGEGDDPGEFSAKEVQAYLATAPDDEKARVLEAEATGKNRSTLLQQ